MSTISSGTTLTTALVQTGDTTGDLVIKTNNGNTTAATFTTAGNLGIGTGSPGFPLTVSSTTTLSAGQPSIVLQGESNTERMQIRSVTAGGGQPVVALLGARGTVSSPTASQSGDPLGYYQLGGYDGSAYNRSAWVTASAAENWSGTNRGTNLVFSTTPIGSTTIAECLRVGPSGQIGIGGANYGTSGQVLTSNGASAAPSWQSAQAFSSGTVMLFRQTAAPTGWTKDTTNFNDSALRVVTGSVSSGGTQGFTTAFASQTPAGSISTAGLSAGATTLTTAQMPSHKHDLNKYYRANIFYPVDYGSIANGEGTSAVNSDAIANTGGGGSHSHSISGSATFTGTAINLAVKYCDVIFATKD